MIETREKYIDGIKFTVTMLPGMRGLKMQNRLMRTLAPALARAGGDDAGSLPEAFRLLFEKLSDDELEAITKDLLYNATADDKALMPQFDSIMAGRSDLVMKLLMFAIEVNYSRFFGVLKGAIESVVASSLPKGPSSTSLPSSPSSGQPTG